jgi:hypothetical protein
LKEDVLNRTVWRTTLDEAVSCKTDCDDDYVGDDDDDDAMNFCFLLRYLRFGRVLLSVPL